jgi:phage repressor protein C with HTH and peptisase S24 domain
MKETLTSVKSYEKELGSRIELAAGLVGGKKSLSKTTNIPESGIYQYIKGESAITAKRLAGIAEATGVSIAWLAAGEGEMLPGNTNASSTAETKECDYAYVTLYDAECSAGAGSWNEECQPLTQLAFTKYSLRKKGLDASSLSAIRVTGDSMEGDLSDGDAVLIDHAKTEVKGEGIYVIRLGGHLYAKRLQRTFNGVEIISTNKAYKSMHVPEDQLNDLDVIGQVVWAASWTI